MEGVDRLGVPEVARALGISEGAVRKRIARGTLRSERDAEGHVWVLLEAGAHREPTGQDAGHPTGQEDQDRYIHPLSLRSPPKCSCHCSERFMDGATSENSSSTHLGE